MKFNEVKDSGQRQEFDTGSVRDTRDGKGRYDLLPPRALRRVAAHFENGAKKYGDRNWEKGQPLSRYLDSALRHIFGLLEGQNDEDHAAAAAWNMLAFIETAERIDTWDGPEHSPGKPLSIDLDDLGYTKSVQPKQVESQYLKPGSRENPLRPTSKEFLQGWRPNVGEYWVGPLSNTLFYATESNATGTPK